jgi:hypothetical protein
LSPIPGRCDINKTRSARGDVLKRPTICAKEFHILDETEDTKGF